MRIAQREFKPTLAGTLTTLLMLPLLLSLGFWQLRRADEKRALIEQFAAGAATTRSLNAGTLAQLPRFQAVSVYGSYDTAHQVLLDNTPAPSRFPGSGPGYEVLTPLKLDDGSIVLVDRGWLPMGATRAQLPSVDVGGEARSLHGRLAELPRAGLHMRGGEESSAWPRVLNYPTMEDLCKLYGPNLLERIVLLDPVEPDGYTRDFDARFSFSEFGPERHIAYAVQWFGLAATLVVIYFVVSLKRP